MRKGKFILILITIISVIISIYSYENQKYNTNLADQILMTSLSSARDDFAVDYSKMNDADKTTYYTRISANLYTVVNILDLTSYSHDPKIQKNLFNATHNLYLCMTRNDSQDAITSTKNMPIIYDCLSKIILDPKDEKDSQTISQIAGNLYFYRIK